MLLGSLRDRARDGHLPASGGRNRPGFRAGADQQLRVPPRGSAHPLGQTVTWLNCEEDATSHTSHANDETWSSPLLSPGTTFSHTFDQAGTFDYHCDPHPFMTGRVVVE